MSLLAALQQHQAKCSFNRGGVDESRLSPGSVVVIRDENDVPRHVTLNEYEEDGKNGNATVGYTDSDGDGRWAYTSQILKVISY